MWVPAPYKQTKNQINATTDITAGSCYSRDLSACSAQGVCAYIASSSFECSSRTQQKNGDGRFSTLQSIHKKMGSGSSELPYLAVFRDFIVHSAVLQTLKFEKGSKKGA